MSQHSETRRVTAPDIKARKGQQKDRVADGVSRAHGPPRSIPHVDFLLVGDSLGMVMHGHETTVPVPLELMIMHGAAVVRGSRRALVVVDMPFGSYEESPAVAFRNAVRIMKETGCGAVKLEGGRRMAETITYLVERGIPVMAHIGLTPQSVNVMGGFKTQGRHRNQWAAIEADAAAVADAGAFAVVLEGMAELLAAKITRAISHPNHRHRGFSRMRRPDSCAGRYAWPFADRAKVREEVRGTWRGDRRRGKRLCCGSSRQAVSGQGTCLRHGQTGCRGTASHENVQKEAQLSRCLIGNAKAGD